jgi:RNA polymerase sigma-70 factor (ECF subfamily)
MSDMLLHLEPQIPALRRFARALLRDRAAADDLVQDCLERAVSGWHRRREGSPKAWLFAILHNLAIDRFRQTKNRGRHTAIEDTDEAELSEGPAQERTIMLKDVLEKLGRLPDDLRAVLLLVAVEDFSYAETAKTLGIPIGTVMSRLARARERLQQELEGTRDMSTGTVVTLRSVR